MKKLDILQSIDIFSWVVLYWSCDPAIKIFLLAKYPENDVIIFNCKSLGTVLVFPTADFGYTGSLKAIDQRRDHGCKTTDPSKPFTFCLASS